MSENRLRAVVATSTLDLGIDWGDVDLVINVGAPKGASRLLQRIGRANHRLDEPSRAVLIPANRFEVLECQAALGAVRDNAQDTPPIRSGALDVLAQHVLGCAVGEPFRSEELYEEVRSAAPYARLAREDFDAGLDDQPPVALADAFFRIFCRPCHVVSSPCRRRFPPAIARGNEVIPAIAAFSGEMQAPGRV